MKLILRILSFIIATPIICMEQPPEKSGESSYAWRKKISVTRNPALGSYKNKNKIIIKTPTADWLGTKEPVVIIFSIHSAFHEGPLGQLKAQHLISNIKQHVSGKVTLLFHEAAHVKAISMQRNINEIETKKLCLADARALAELLQPYCQGCDIQFWHTLISNDPEYSIIKQKIQNIYATDAQFQRLLREDAQGCYTPERAKLGLDKELFISKTMEDIQEQIVYLCIASKKGYKFEFYPGKPHTSAEYLKHEHHINRISVSIGFRD